MSLPTIITGVIGADAHIVGNRIIQKVLEQEGFKVVGLGALTPADEFIKAAIETNAAAIVISSLYGHAELDCEGFRDKCREAGLQDILLYIGGNLAVGKHDFKETEVKFRKMGFNRVYSPDTDLKSFVKVLKKDLGLIAGD
ncbi:MAG: methylaspartate mutase subunit S [Desulfocucumaceae bacterium]